MVLEKTQKNLRGGWQPHPPPPHHHLLLVRLHPKVNKKLSIVLSTVASVLHLSYPSI